MNDISEVPTEPGTYLGGESLTWMFDGDLWHYDGDRYRPHVMSNDSGPFERIYTSSDISAAKADAWDEGHEAGHADYVGSDGTWPSAPNPHRAYVAGASAKTASTETSNTKEQN